MQSNIYTSKINNPPKPSKLEASERVSKADYKGKTWQRGTDKREMYNYAFEAR